MRRVGEPVPEKPVPEKIPEIPPEENADTSGQLPASEAPAPKKDGKKKG